MAQEITSPLYGQQVSDPDGAQAAADQTGTSSTLDFGSGKPRNRIQVHLFQKTFTAGTGANRPQYQIQVADDTGFATNLRRIGFLEMPRFSNCSEYRHCYVPDRSSRYCRIVPTLDGTDTINYDVKVLGS